MNGPFQKAKQILLHPNFNKLNPLQIQQVFQSLLASGLTKDDIQNILTHNELMSRGKAFLEKARLQKEKEIEFRNNMSRLERLPKDIFKHLVEKGEIQGRDLVYLCNSSPILRQYCLADSYDVNGQLIETQTIYRKALERVLGKEEAKESSSPSYLYNRLVNSYTVTVMSRGFARTIFEPVKSPKYIRQIAFSKNFRVILDYFGMVRIKTVGIHIRNDLRDIKIVAVTDQAVLCMDENSKLWFFGNIRGIATNENLYFSNPIEVLNNFTVSSGETNLKLNIKDIKGDSDNFYILTEEGNFYRMYYALGTPDVKIDYFFISLVESGVDSFYISDKRIYTLIHKDGSIKSGSLGFPNKLFLEQGEIAIKAMTYFGWTALNGETYYYLLVLTSEHNLWLSRSNNQKIGLTLVKEGVLDFEVMKRNKSEDKLYFIGTNGKLYQVLIRGIDDPENSFILLLDEQREGLPKIDGLTKIQIEYEPSYDRDSDVYLFKPVF